MKMLLKRVRPAALPLALLAGVTFTPGTMAGGFALVTNGDDAGEGSLRHAIEESGASVVVISPAVSDIEILSTLEYKSEKPLRITGTGQTISTDLNITLFAATQGADVSMTNLTFEGPGGFDITRRGDLGQEAGKGIFVDVRPDQTGNVSLQLVNVSVSGVANHGIHVSDCSLADDCGGGGGGSGDGSSASITVVCVGCKVDDVGNGKFDADGLRVDDRGDGSVHFFSLRSTFTNVGADGVELDEGDAGDVRATVIATDLSNNGAYCDPSLLEPFLPDPEEAEFDESDQVNEVDIPGEVTGSPDDSCFEREVDLYDSGFVEAYEFGIDLDDGIDFDEAGAGSLVALLKGSTISGNLDEGVDFDEEDDGNVVVRYIRTHAAGNNDDGYKVTEEDDGNVVGEVHRSSATDNGGKGFVFEEEDDGDLNVSVVGSSTANNDDSDDTGIEAVQEPEGTGTLKVRDSDIPDGIDLDGVDLI